MKLDKRSRRDTCKVCAGPLFILKWAKVKPRTCYGCAAAKKAAKRNTALAGCQ